MNPNSRRTEWVVWGFLLLVIVVIVGLFIAKKTAGEPLPIYSQVGEFSLTDQHGQTFTTETMRGEIWIADVIFTRCPLQCIRMTKRMRELQDALPKDTSVKFVSITADPQFDTPEVLKNYGEQFGADQDRWWFLTGEKREINELAVNGLKLVVYEKKPEEREIPNDLFLHSTKFVLVDGKGRIRGWYDAENAGSKGEILKAVKQLRREKKS